MIKVCDAIMGTGKSSAAITYMNEHPDDKFIYVTPYLEEATRIKESCPVLRFVEPSNKLVRCKFSKNSHTQELIEHDCNIATTHQAFKNYNPEMLDMIRDKGYTLIVDENVDTLKIATIDKFDLDMLEREGYIALDGSKYVLTEKKYGGSAFSGFFKFVGNHTLEVVDSEDDKERTTVFFWVLPAELLSSFKDVYILTYMFEGQSLNYMMGSEGLVYEKIRVSRDSGGTFRFADKGNYVPDYVSRLDELINIIDGERINAVGEDKYALSLNWFQRNGSDVEQLKRNAYNFFNKIAVGSVPSTRLWSTFKNAYSKLRGKGYSNAFLPFNTRATNTYRECAYLAYMVNIFNNVDEKAFYKARNIKVDDDAYALSTMLQWIWRSAIRDGNKIMLYLPSKRMRDLLTQWIQKTMKGGETTG